MITFLLSAYFSSVAVFVTIAKLKIESIPDFNTVAIFLINQHEETCEKQFSFFAL